MIGVDSIASVPAMGQDGSWAESEYKRAKELYGQEDYTAAEQALNNCLPVFQSLGKKKYELYCFEYLAKIYNKTQRYDQAVAMNFQCLSLASSLNDLEGVGLANNRLGVNYYNKEDYQSAAIYYEAALAQSRQSGKTDDIKIDLQNLADTYEKLGRYDDASKYRAEKLALEGTTTGDGGEGSVTSYSAGEGLSVTQADELRKSGEEKMKSGDYSSAVEDFQSALGVYRAKNDEQYMKWTLEMLGRSHYYLRQYDLSQTHASEALVLAQKTNDNYGQGFDYNTIGMSQYYRGQLNDALTSFITAYSFNNLDGSSKSELKSTVYFIAQIYKNMGDYSAAAPYEQQYNVLQLQGY
jgi:tetratricopeptide (TPR) repeat protein